ncbi:MAG: zinc transporter ZupT [Firmicutes bacterium]|nr:zinc transporter ZupT [Bacillota bacterium]
MSDVLLAALLTLFAGLATSVGGAIAFYAKRTNTRFLAIALGFSAGVMIYVSLMEIMVKAEEILIESMGEVNGSWVTVIAFFAGMAFIAIIDKFIPSFEESPDAGQTVQQAKESGTTGVNKYNYSLLRMGMFTALAVGIHNFPEGFITFFSTLRDPVLGVSIAIAVAIHNIPEGIAVAVPIFYATGSRKKAFVWASLSGLAEPVGALVGYVLLAPILSDTIYGIVFASVAGIMVYISFDQLLPAARKYGEHHLSVLGLVAGMALMALSLLLFM